MNILLTTLNAKYIHTNLAIRYLKAFARPEFDPTIVEFTIKEPTLNIVTDLHQRKPDLVGFSCYIWNIEETIKVIQMLRVVSPHTKIVLGGPEVSYDVRIGCDDWKGLLISSLWGKVNILLNNCYDMFMEKSH